MIAIINYGVGNVGSIKNMLHKLGYDSIITNNFDEINQADKLILPGVGSFDEGMSAIIKLGLVDIIRDNVLIKRKSILGICLGMQILGLQSEEGKMQGLSLVPFVNKKFESKKIDEKNVLRVPHMGWREVKVTKTCSLTISLELNTRFYFVHSYYVPYDEKYTCLSTEYGVLFSAAIKYDNIYGTQFHPEKSHSFGMKILKSFVESC